MDDSGLQARIQAGVDEINRRTGLKIEEFIVAGAMFNELSVEWEHPTVEFHDGLIVISERMRVL